MKGSLLLIEDDRQLASVVGRHMERTGFSVKTVHSGEDAIDALKANSDFDAAIVDIDLSLGGGDMDGLDVARAVYYQSDAVCIMLTAFSHQEYGDQSYALGAKAYIQKSNPDFIPMLKNTIGALLELKTTQTSSTLSCGSLKLNLHNQRVSEGETRLDLSPMEFKTLLALMKQCQEAVSKDDLHLSLYPNPDPDNSPPLSIIESYISTLRKKLNVCKIDTVRGVGYRLTPEDTT